VADFRVTAPIADDSCGIELVGSEDVKFDGALLASCIQEALRCAAVSGCLTPGGVRLTEKCVETFARHNAATDCEAQGFGFRVNPLAQAFAEKKQR
jgi:hypothetical protein